MMEKSRRLFFRKLGIFAAAPAVGIAKAIGASPAPLPKPPFETDQILEAKDLNDRFNAIHDRLDSI